MIDTLPFWLASQACGVYRTLRLAAAEIEALERNRLRRLLRAACRSSLHCRRLRDAGIRPNTPVPERDPERLLQALAPVSKEELREAGADAFAGGELRPNWRCSLSSGSTGEPFRVYFDPRAWATLKFLVKLRARLACGLRPHHRVAMLDAFAPGSARSLLEQVGRVRRISILQPAAAVARSLSAFRPDAVYGLPSALLETADALGAGQGLAVRRIFTGGELLQAGARRTLEEAFAGSVYDVYGTSETKEIAWECRRGGLHLNADVVRIEVLDAGGAPVEAGDEGDIVATLLVNEAMPLVRYRTGDRGTLLPRACDCGLALPLLGVVTGREADTLEIGGGQRVSPYALTSALEAVAGLRRYQVSQLGRTRLRVRAMKDAASDREQVAAGIRSVLHARVSAALGVEVEFVDGFASDSRSKFRVVEPLARSAAAEREERG